MEEAVAMKWHLSLGAKLMLLFTVLPLVELALLVQLTRVTNLWVTLLMIAVPGILGAMIIKREGLATWRRAMEALAQGKFPADELLSGLVLLLGGALLLTPGVITDLVGFVDADPGGATCLYAEAARLLRETVPSGDDAGRGEQLPVRGTRARGACGGTETEVTVRVRFAVRQG
jgi:UPF0716 protein FxsA